MAGTTKKSPALKLRESFYELLEQSGSFHDKDIDRLLAEVPRKWEQHGDLIIIPQNALKSESWKLLGSEPYVRICKELKAKRIARKNKISSDTFRSSQVELLWGDNGIVVHTDNKIKLQWDVTKCMFSIGNITEKLRIASFDCSQEIVVDLFAGIGYFVLPYLVHARAKHVHACEINPDSIEALKINLKLNRVEDRCTIHEGDNRETCPNNVADRVNLGLIPSSEISWETACRALKNDSGGVLHIHANIDSAPEKKDSINDDSIDDERSIMNLNSIWEGASFKRAEWKTWTCTTVRKIEKLLFHVKQTKWSVHFRHLEHVKSYAPHVDHVVLDILCKPVVL